MPGPAAHMPRQPSTLPTTPPPAPGCAPGRWPLAHPDPLPARADSAPTDWLAGSVRRNSSSHPHKLPPPHPASAPPALQITRAHTCLLDTPPPSRSTHTTTDYALLLAAVAAPLSPASHRPPSLPAAAAGIPGSAPPSLARTVPSHTPNFPRSVRRLPA